MAAAVIYTIGDLHRPGRVIDYPRGGGGAVIDAMVRVQGQESNVSVVYCSISVCHEELPYLQTAMLQHIFEQKGK